MQRQTSGRIRRTLFTGLWTVVAMLVVVPAASAYIDPGTTSMLFTAVVAGFAAAGTAVTMFWSRILGFFQRNDEPTDPRSE